MTTALDFFFTIVDIDDFMADTADDDDLCEAAISFLKYMQLIHDLIILNYCYRQNIPVFGFELNKSSSSSSLLSSPKSDFFLIVDAFAKIIEPF